MRRGKKYNESLKKIDRMNEYSPEEALELVKANSKARFDETVEATVNLGVDPKRADQNIRVTTSLPHGTGKEVSVLVLASGPKEKEALEAGADYVGNKEYLDKIKGGWADVDKIIATPDMMGELGKLGRILGPKGLMPNPKSGTVTMDVAKAVKDLKAGQVELRVEKTGIVHVPCGKSSFEKDAIVENIRTIYDTLIKNRPASVKGQYLEKMSVSSTMGPGIKIDHASIR